MNIDFGGDFAVIPKEEITKIIGEVIARATAKQGWSIAELTRRVGKGPSTLHRWKQGTTASYDLGTVVEIFQLAGMSMDEAFNLLPQQVRDNNADRLRQVAIKANAGRITF